jgi:hypothetical protein
MIFENRRLRVVGTGDTLREGSSGLGRLVIDMAEKRSAAGGTRDGRAETVGVEV